MNCLIVDDDAITRALFEAMIKKTPFLKLVDKCSNALEASSILLNNKIDLIFLDVQMPGMSGIDLMKSFTKNMRPEIILITSNPNYAMDAYDLNAIDILLKPVQQERFLRAVFRAKEIYDFKHLNSSGNDLFIKVDSRLIKINMRDIFLIEGLADYISIHTSNGKYTVLSTMKGVESKLPAGDFLRVHNSYIVRIDRISEIEDNSLLIEKRLVPVSRSNKKDLMRRLRVL